MKALRKSQLADVGEPSAGGSHKVSKVTFIEKEKTRVGFVKYLDPEHGFPEFLCKLSVAISTAKRACLGSRTAEERLVLDDNGTIVGLLSIAIDGLKPLAIYEELDKVKDKDRELVIPSTETLIKYKMMYTLVTRILYFKDDDTHPQNVALIDENSEYENKGKSVDYDNDMGMHPFAIIAKGERPIVGDTTESFCPSDWASFPNLKNLKPWHCPSYDHPGQGNIPAIIGTKLPKRYPNPEQFQQLASDPRAQAQKVEAGLHALLTYQPKMIRAQLEEQFAGIKLNYTSLEEKKRRKYEEKFKDFCNEKTNEEPFVDFFMNLLQSYYDEMFRVVVFFQGCPNNGYSLSLPPTYKELYMHPDYFKNIEAWVKEENKANSSQDPALQYNLDELKQRYHQVWRGAFAPTLRELMESSYNLTTLVLALVTSERAPKEKEGIKTAVVKELSGKAVTDESVKEVWDLFRHIPKIAQADIKDSIHVDPKNSLRTALSLLIDFTTQFNQIVEPYISKRSDALTIDDNTVFVDKLRKLHSDFEVTICESLSQTTTEGTEFDRIARGIEEIIKLINFKRHLTTTDERMLQSASSLESRDILPLNNEAVISQFTKNLFTWANGLEAEVFKRHIVDIIDKYYVPSTISLSGLTGSRTREQPVKQYLQLSVNTPRAEQLAFIFASGEDIGALNTLLIRHLAPLVKQSMPQPTISKAMEDKKFNTESNLALYTQAAVNYAREGQRYKNLTTSDGRKQVYTSLFNWCAELSPNQFVALLKSTLAEYEKSSWWKARSKEMKGYIAYPTNQVKVIALIFANKEEDSGLSKILFNKIMQSMQEQLPGTSIVMQYHPQLHESIFVSKELQKVSLPFTHHQLPTAPARTATM